MHIAPVANDQWQAIKANKLPELASLAKEIQEATTPTDKKKAEEKHYQALKDLAPAFLGRIALLEFVDAVNENSWDNMDAAFAHADQIREGKATPGEAVEDAPFNQDEVLAEKVAELQNATSAESP